MIDIVCEKHGKILTDALMSEHPVMAVEQLRMSGWLAEHIPELEAMVGMTQNSYHFGTVWEHSMAVLDKISDKELALRLAALMHDVGKTIVRSVDDKGVAHFYGHEKAGAKMARTILKRLGFLDSIAEMTIFLIVNHMKMKNWGDECANMKDKALRKIQYLCHDRKRFELLLSLIDADNKSHAESHCMRQQVSLVRKASQHMDKKGTAMFDFKMPLTNDEMVSHGIAETEVLQCKTYLLKLAYVNPCRNKKEWIKLLNGFNP